MTMRGNDSATVAVAVVSWNTRDLLARCLSSLEGEAAAGRAEVWVVDNASSDGSAALAESYAFAQVLALETNVGFGPAVDLVAAQTSTPWLACANADVALTPGALERLLAAGELRQRVGAVAPRLLLADGRAQHSVHAFPRLRVLLAYQAAAGRLFPRLAERLALPGYWDPERARTVDWAVGAFLLIRREALQQAGGMTNNDRFLYTEDLDLGWCLRSAGWRIWYEPSAAVEHAESAATTWAMGDRRHAVSTAATYAWMLRRRGLARTLTTASANVGGALVRAGGAVVRRPGTPAWRERLGEARLHAGGVRHALRRHR